MPMAIVCLYSRTLTPSVVQPERFSGARRTRWFADNTPPGALFVSADLSAFGGQNSRRPDFATAGVRSGGERRRAGQDAEVHRTCRSALVDELDTLPYSHRKSSASEIDVARE